MAFVHLVLAAWFVVGLAVIVRRRAWRATAASMLLGLLAAVGWIPWLRGRVGARLERLAKHDERS